MEIDVKNLVYPFTAVRAEWDYNGYIMWRTGTGNNTELLHLKTFTKGKGTGKELFIKMLSSLLSHPPYSTVFGFTRTSNTEACRFYERLGFDLTCVKGVYADGTAIIFSQLFDVLVEKHLRSDNDPNVQGQPRIDPCDQDL